MNVEILSKAANQARGLAIDAVHACNSGHLGLPLGCAELGAVLFGSFMRYNPDAPRWINRDRFVLSGGHGSMFLYSWLHLAGYDLSMEEVKSFRKLHSKTPGHPEYMETPGVECTTGPLGQGIGNAVGMALAGKMNAARFNKPGAEILDYRVMALAGDGCMQEGVSSEACALAAHMKLDNLILFYDSNDVTLDAMACASQSEDTAMRYRAYGWDVQTVTDGHDPVALAAACDKARAELNGRPKLIIVKTIIGKGIEEVQGTAKGHGEGGAKFADKARAGLGLPADEHFYVSADVRAFFAARKQALTAACADWCSRFGAWSRANPELARDIELPLKEAMLPAVDLMACIPAFNPEKKIATRVAGGIVLQPLAAKLNRIVGGSADLYGSTKNYIEKLGDISAADYSGRNIRYGIREHAMGAIMNGMAYDGYWMPSGATFLTFSDYMRPAIRLAALAKLPVQYIFTHDSVGVGEDGPTHQPIETTSSLRLIPNLDVIRPADGEETAAAFASAMSRKDGPTALILSRQDLPNQSSLSVEARRMGTLKGAYVAKRETADLSLILIASGSELQHAMKAAAELGAGTRVVSMPCMELFERQSPDYKESVLPAACAKRIAMEAGVTANWYKYASTVVGIDRFGISAPGDKVMEILGMTAENLVSVAKSLPA
ncbi:MAG: transketolase [Opitutales bacterium]|jgi:transketolase